MKHQAIKTFTLQQDHADCGIACLLSIIKFHQGECDFEKLRKLSGTSRQGTTLLGLLHAAEKVGLSGVGLQADSVENLRELNEPVILHVILENQLQHYVVYYPDKISKHVLIGDPGRGVLEMNKEELNRIWQSKALLKLTPTSDFPKKKELRKKKRKWIVSLIRDDLPLLAASVFLGIVISLLGISTAIFSQQLIDTIIPKENLQKLILSLVLVFLLLLARSGLTFVRGLLMIRQSSDFNNRIIAKFYSNLLSLSKSFFDSRKTGDLVARMNDTRRIQSVLSAISGSIIIDLLVVIISLGFVFMYSMWIGILLLISLPVFILILYSFNQRVSKHQKELMAGYAATESNFIDTIQGVADIKLMNRQTFFERINSSIYGEFQTRIVRLGKVNIKFSLASDVTSVFFIITTFGISAWLVLSKQLKFGEMVALLSMAVGVVQSVTRLIISNIQIQEALVAFDRMHEFSLIEREDLHASDSLNLEFKELKIKNLSFRFPGRKQLLKTVSLFLKKGEITALLGESGQGKSTLLQLIQKFYSPEEGSIIIDDLNINKLSPSDLRSNLGSIPQEPKIFNGSLLYNLTLSDEEEEYRNAVLFCETSGFGKYFGQFPQGYSTLLGEEGVNLSGGQKQLVVFARTLLRKPKVLLLDEATSAMDMHTENFILSLLKQGKNDRITLIVTHRIKTAQWCDRIALLENGTITNSGTRNELLTSQNFFSEAYRELVEM